METEESFKAWTCGDQYTFAFDDAETAHKKDDPWKGILEHISTKETVRCELWNDEIQNLLVFSGLFSAVVTALIIESYSDLLPNTNDALLSRISIQLAFLGNNTAQPPSLFVPPSFSPTTSSKRINALWFLSLFLSLTSALIGIVALQWLREHLRPSRQNVPLRVAAPLLHMNARAFDLHLSSLHNDLPLPASNPRGFAERKPK